ncbi:hypothetical protein BO71DRAFT_321008, partial [Aspergillus ellipticus CBS 707.79]
YSRTPQTDWLVLHETQLPSCIQPQLNRSSTLPQGYIRQATGWTRQAQQA